MPASATPAFVEASLQAGRVFERLSGGERPTVRAARATLDRALPTGKLDSAPVYAALATLSGDVARRVQGFGSLAHVQWSTVRSIAFAWVTTLPAAMLLAGLFYWILRGLVT